MRDGSEKAVNGSDDISNEISDVVDEAEKEGIEIQRVEDAFNDVDKMAKADDEFEVDINIGDCDIDFLDRDLYSSVDGNKACNLCVQVNVGLEFFHS